MILLLHSFFEQKLCSQGKNEDFAQPSRKLTGIKSRHRILINVKHISLTGKGLRKTSSSVL